MNITNVASHTAQCCSHITQWAFMLDSIVNVFNVLGQTHIRQKHFVTKIAFEGLILEMAV